MHAAVPKIRVGWINYDCGGKFQLCCQEDCADIHWSRNDCRGQHWWLEMSKKETERGFGACVSLLTHWLVNLCTYLPIFPGLFRTSSYEKLGIWKFNVVNARIFQKKLLKTVTTERRENQRMVERVQIVTTCHEDDEEYTLKIETRWLIVYDPKVSHRHYLHSKRMRKYFLRSTVFAARNEMIWANLWTRVWSFIQPAGPEKPGLFYLRPGKDTL